MTSPRRLVLVGSVLVDVVMFVPRLPERGGDVLADDAMIAVGGGFNVLAAAARQGLRARYAGRHGTGRFGEQVRGALAAEGIAAALPPDPSGDTGWCVVLVDADGERTFATRSGVDGQLTPDDLRTVRFESTDLVYLSGYELVYAHGPAVGAWFAALDDGLLTVVDPGPLIGDAPAEVRDAVLRRANWVSLNAREAAALTGVADAEQASATLRRNGIGRRGVIVRDGSAGCILLTSADGTAQRIPVPIAVPGPVLDTSGAGDAHVGAFVAALGRGLDPADAGRWANAAAARSVTVRGAASCPTLARTAADLAAA